MISKWQRTQATLSLAVLIGAGFLVLDRGVWASEEHWRATAFFILGCVSLDWDGLNYLEEKGYLAVPEEGTYLPTACQPLPREVLRQLYWGSHNYHDREAVTTFGDHYSLPRTGLPDVLWRLSVDAPQPVKGGVESAAKASPNRTGCLPRSFPF